MILLRVRRGERVVSTLKLEWALLLAAQAVLVSVTRIAALWRPN